MAQYKIQQGDTLTALARKYGTTVDALMDANKQIKDKDLIYYDRMMNVPGADTVAGTPPNIVGGPSVASPDQINQAINQYSSVAPAPPSAVDYAQSVAPNQADIDKVVASSGSFADAFGSVKDYINASRQEQIAKEQETGTATGMPAFKAPEMQARSQEGQPTLSDIFNVNPEQIAGATTGGFDPSVLAGQPTIKDMLSSTPPPATNPYQIMEGGSPMDALSPIKDSVIKSANKAGTAVKEVITTAPDNIKGALSNFANNEIAPILAGLNRADRSIKDGDLTNLMKKYSDSVSKYAGQGAESFAKNIGIIRKDFIENLSDFAQNNNLDMTSIVEAIDVDALYDATGVRNKKKDREEKVMKAKLEAERNARMANLQNQNASQINAMMQPTSAYAGGGLAQQAANVASKGRYGDTMLMHVNPAEVAGLSQVMPLTVNPDTGQPEAFLPFLLPLLGSVGGSALAGSSLLAGTALAGKAALLGAIGSGLGTYAATGDAKKGLMSGLLGFGVNKALGAGANAAQGAKDTAFAASVPETATLASTPTNAMADYTAALAKNPSLATQQGSSASLLNNLKTVGSSPKAGITGLVEQASKPSTFMPMYMGAAGYGMMNSQEDFNRQMENLKANDTEEYNRILAEHPEYVPMLQQNQMFAKGGQAKKEFKPVAAIQARDIDPNFMAGFQGERGYLKNVNPSSGQIISGKTGYDFGTEMADAPMSAPFDPTQTAGYKAFYNAPREPYVLDPYAKQTFTQPEAPIIQPILAPPPSQTTEPEPVATLPVPPPEESRVAPFNPASYINPESLNQIASMFSPGMSREAKEELDTGVPMQGMMDVTAPPPRSAPAPAPAPSALDNYNAYLGGQGNMMAGLSREEINSGAFDPSMLTPPPAPPPQSFAYASPEPIGRGQDRDIGNNEEYNQSQLNTNEFISSMIPPRVTGDALNNRRRTGGGRNRKAEGGPTDLPNEGLEALNKVAPDAVDAMGYQEGGLTEQAMTDPLTQEVVQYITGQSGNDEAIAQFVNKYGNEAFMQLREMALQQVSPPQAQTEGLVAGANMGGMTDDVPMTISGQPAAVSQGEFIVPSDVVSMLGDGDTESGANSLYGMMDRVRKTKTGTTDQAPPFNNLAEMMPA